MGFNHRILLPCSDSDHDCHLPPAPAPPSQSSNNTQLLVILMVCALGTAFVVVCYLSWVKKYYSNPNNLRRRNRNRPVFVVDADDDDHQEDFVDENQGPVIEHHIWYINTIGLQQSVIDSISVFKYKKNEGLIEGTDCSVCLTEFEEDETLRLLPKCSHAFHIPCIDTWLRSHKNCPLCRAPIVSEAILAQESAPEPNSNRLGMREDESFENFRELGEDGNLGNENCGGLPTEEVTNFENLMKDSPCFRVVSDLGDHRLKVEEELQAVRRSVSMDDSSASRIYLAVANIPIEGCSSNRLVQGKKVNSEKVVKGVSDNLRIAGLMKSSSSLGCSLQKGPKSMKRSFSSNGLFSFSRRYTKSQDSILPC